MRLGVCYYPEHWPRERWALDARAMRALGIGCVRIGEFAWSRLEPEPGRYAWQWLDEAVETLAAADLEIVLGTPTATPPRWLVGAHPEILPRDANGNPRGFGSRRHYCFSSPVYREHCRRIVAQLAQRYGQHPAVVAWQTDNEYGCHDTVLSYSEAAADAFRQWLRERYGDIARLNEAWGTVFWSQEYRDFAEIDPPAGTVTEANPAQRLDFQRYASAAVASFNREQVEILRAASPGRDVLHNFMGFFTGFDHFEVARDLDVATWDSYPLGFLEQRSYAAEQDKACYARTGHPDIAAFHHDLYRGVGRGRWWVMEQQPGPVNWAPYNPAPLPGMVRLWTLEACAHGAEVVSYFRWRQAPFGQEQMHAGLLRADASPDQGAAEVRRAADDLARLDPEPTRPAPVALLFDYTAKWWLDIQPQGADFDYLRLVMEWYGALRERGLDVDIVGTAGDLAPYAALFAPSLPIVEPALAERLTAFEGHLLLGPRSGSRTCDARTPPGLPPGPLQALTSLRVVGVESLRPGSERAVRYAGRDFAMRHWCEQVQCELDPLARFADGGGAYLRHGKVRYLAGWPDAGLLGAVLDEVCAAAGVHTVALPRGLRLRRRGSQVFAFNYGPQPVELPVERGRALLLGERTLPVAGVAVWREA